MSALEKLEKWCNKYATFTLIGGGITTGEGCTKLSLTCGNRIVCLDSLFSREDIEEELDLEGLINKGLAILEMDTEPKLYQVGFYFMHGTGMQGAVVELKTPIKVTYRNDSTQLAWVEVTAPSKIKAQQLIETTLDFTACIARWLHITEKYEPDKPMRVWDEITGEWKVKLCQP